MVNLRKSEIVLKKPLGNMGAPPRQTITVWVILGVSRSGKDTVAGYLSDHLRRSTRIKFASPVKRTLEAAYGLPEGAMEDPRYRSSQVPNFPGTYLDLLIHLWKTAPGGQGLVWEAWTRTELRAAIRDGRDIILTDLRNHGELELVREILKDGHRLTLIRLDRPGFSGVPSDRNLEEYQTELQKLPHSFYHILNDGPQGHLEQTIKTLTTSENENRTI